MYGFNEDLTNELGCKHVLKIQLWYFKEKFKFKNTSVLINWIRKCFVSFKHPKIQVFSKEGFKILIFRGWVPGPRRTRGPNVCLCGTRWRRPSTARSRKTSARSWPKIEIGCVIIIVFYTRPFSCNIFTSTYFTSEMNSYMF